ACASVERRAAPVQQQQAAGRRRRDERVLRHRRRLRFTPVAELSMSWKNKVIWSEGLFLQPHHFQQHDRYVESYVDGRCRPLRGYGWGFTEIKLDAAQLAIG